MNGAIKHGTSAAPWFVFLNYHSTYQRAHLEYDNYNTNDNVVSQTCLGLFRRSFCSKWNKGHWKQVC